MSLRRGDAMQSEWTIVANETNFLELTIRDRDQGKRSVTNDIENVVDYCLEHGHLRQGMRFFYYDSDGIKDEILFDENGFLDFEFYGERN